jgi:virginiamycin B lyase
MRRSKTTLVATATAVAALGVMPLDARGQDTQDVQIQEWEVPYPESRPRDPYVGPDGRVWFVGQRSDYVAVLDPETGEFDRFDLPEGAGPHNLIVADAGDVFYAGNRAAHIGRLDPKTGEIEQFPMPNGDPRDPHTLVHDGKGGVWFTAQGANKVGHFVPSTGEVHIVTAPERPGRGGEMTGVRPYGIKMDSQGRPWIALVGSNLIGMVDPATMEMETFEVPQGAAPRRLVIDSDDMVWYVDHARGKLARLDPGTGEVREWDSPGGAESRPYGMAIDASDRIWYVETGPDANPFVGFDPATEEFTVTPIPSGAGAVRHMYYDENTNSIWFGTDANTIGQAMLPPLRNARISDAP